MGSAFRQSAAIIVAFTSIGYAAAADSAGEEALEAYQAFAEARASATSLEEIYPFLPAAQVEKLKQLPAETVQLMGKKVIGSAASGRPKQPSGGLALRNINKDGAEAELLIESVAVEDGVRTEMTLSVDMVEEDDGWKVTNPQPRPWRTVSRMPEDDAGTEHEIAAGPAASEWPAVRLASADQFNLVAERKLDSPANPNKLRWDPKGRYILVGTNSELALFEMTDLNPLWGGRVASSFAGGVLGADGEVFITQDPYREPISVHLGVSARLDAPAEAAFFEVVDLPARREGIGEVKRYNVETIHPQQPIIAMGLSGETGDAIGFAALEKGVDSPADWDATDPQLSMAFSPDGEMLAWLSGFAELGSPVIVSAWPDGKTVHELAAPEIIPGILMFSSDGARLATLGGDGADYAAFIWNAETGELDSKIPTLRFAAFGSVSGQMIGVHAGNGMIEAGIQDTICVHNISDGTEVAAFQAFPKSADGLPAAITAIEVSPNGRYAAAVASQDGETVLKVWEIQE